MPTALYILHGIVIGVGLKILSITVTKLLIHFNINELLNEFISNNPTSASQVGNNLGILIILLSLGVSLFYKWKTNKDLDNSQQKKFSLRLGLLIVFSSIFGLLQTLDLRDINTSFLWATSLLQPDTIGTIEGYPINLIATLTLGTYLIYVWILGKRRKTISISLHASAALSFFILSYNNPSGFFLFWLFQSISLLKLSYRLSKIYNNIR